MKLHTYIINIKQRTDRYAHIINEVKKLPILEYKVIEAVASGTGLYSQPRIRCFQSHLNCIKLAKESELPYVLVLEDDATFTKNCLNSLRQALHEIDEMSWDMLYLGANLHSPACKISSNLLKLTGAWCTHAYIVHSNFYDTILSLPLDREIDVHYTDLMRDNNIFMTNPIISYQLPSHSDLQNEFCDYSGAMDDNFLKFTQ